MAGIKGKIKFIGKVRGTWKLQAGTMIAQIADHAGEYRMVSQQESGRLAYDRPLNTATLEHDLFQTGNSTKISLFRISFPIGNWTANAPLICGNPSRS